MPSTANSTEVSGIPELQEVFGYVYFTQRIYRNNSVGSSNQNAQVEVSLGIHHDDDDSDDDHEDLDDDDDDDDDDDYLMNDTDILLGWTCWSYCRITRPPLISWHCCFHAPINPHHLQKYQLPCIMYETCRLHARYMHGQIDVWSKIYHIDYHEPMPIHYKPMLLAFANFASVHLQYMFKPTYTQGS